jgi:hypothetical protein
VIKRESIQRWVQEQIMLSLGLSEYEGGKADGRLHSPNEMIGFRASADALARRAGAACRSLLLRPGRAGDTTELGKIRGP